MYQRSGGVTIKSVKAFVWSIVFLAVIAGYGLSKHKLDEQIKKRDAEIEVRYLPSPQLARLLSIGYSEALANIYWIEAINYFGGQLGRNDRSYTYLKDFCDIIVYLDPYFYAFYDWASTAFVYNGLPVTRDGIVQSLDYMLSGIQRFHEIGRISPDMMRKAGFSFSLDAGLYEPASYFFDYAGRMSSRHRDSLLLSSVYNQYLNQVDEAVKRKEEYLSFTVYEARSSKEIQYAIQVLSSPTFNEEAADFMRSLRVQMETDEELKKLVKKRLESDPFFEAAVNLSNERSTDSRINQLLQVDIDRNWLPPNFHLLMNL